jgi:DNA-binding transcriptional MerR regulator/methylmalonyl-CoA mutase cobalamin-binding subunit
MKIYIGFSEALRRARLDISSALTNLCITLRTDMSSLNDEHLPIRTICTLTGINPMTLRTWERRYDLIRPSRTASGHRLYTHRHVEQIRRVLALVESGVPISHVRDQIDAGRALHSEGPPMRGPWRGYLDGMIEACTRFDEPELDRVYDEALTLYPIEQVTRQLLLPLLAHLGERWREVPGGIAEEHFFATYLRSKLGARLQRRAVYAEGPRLLAACAPGERHEIGLLLFAIEVQQVGMRAIVLGADMPFEELAGAARRARCEAVVISSSVESADGLIERSLRSLVKQVSMPVFFGGPTAVRHRQSIASTGSIPVGTDLADGVRLIAATLAERRRDT